jgi:polyhydroxyalkanoate synthesis regulator phasin
MSSAKRKLAVGAAGLAVFAGAGGAYAATQSSTPSKPPDPSAHQKAFLDDLAKRLNVTSDQLTEAIKGAASDQIDAAVKAGTLTKDQGDAIKKRIANANGLPLGGGLRLGPPPGPGFGGRGPAGPLGFGFGPGKSLSVAAKFLGLSDSALRAQLRDGKSLADVAKAQNKSTADLKATLKTAITSELDQLVKDNKLTADQRTKFEAGLDQRLDDLIDNTRHPAGPRIFGGRFRHP